MQSVYNEGARTFTAYEALKAYARVKIKSGTTATPPDVHYADQGEQAIGVTLAAAAAGELVAVKLMTADGTFLGIANDTFSIGAVLYAHDDGEISDSSSGSAIGVALEAATAAGDIVEWAPYAVLSTTAGTVSVADAGGHTAQTTVEGALAELYSHIDATKKTLPIPLGSLTKEDGTALTKFADGASDVPGFSQESNKEVVLRWNNHAAPLKVVFSVPLPQDLDGTADMSVHWLAKMSDANDTPVLEHECYFGAGDTDCAGTDDEIDGGTTLTEYSATIANADVPDTMPAVLTCVFGPKATELGTDDCLIYAVWLEYECAKLS